MNKILLGVLVALGFSQACTASEYVVKHGDTLTAIAKKTGFTPTQLAQMNDVDVSDAILIGQKLKYFTNKDIVAAELWCKRRMSELSPRDQNHIFFKYTLTDLDQKHFRFSVTEPIGLHVSNIFVFADAWRKYKNT